MSINVVLVEPEIPQNTGNIMRSCVGFNAKLHLIKPLGFTLDEKKLRRSCVDYYDYLNYEVYEDWDDFKSKNPGKYYFFTRYGHKSPISIDFKKEEDKDIYLVLGAESTGIAYDILKDNLDDCYRIPTTDRVRSLNLSNCAAIVMFLASSQIVDPLIYSDEPECFKGKDFIENVNVDELTKVHKEY